MKLAYIESRLKQVFSDVLEIPEDKINNDISPRTIESWDSLQHVVLISAISEEFSITIDPRISMEMISFEKTLDKIILLLKEKSHF